MLLLLTTKTFARQHQPPRVETIESAHGLHVSHVAPVAEKEEVKGVENSKETGSSARRSTDFHISSHATADLFKSKQRLLKTLITDSASLQAAVEAWCLNSTQAAEIYGDISTWCVKYLVLVLHILLSALVPRYFLPSPLPRIALPHQEFPQILGIIQENPMMLLCISSLSSLPPQGHKRRG